MKLSFLLFLFASLEPTAANECADCTDFLSNYKRWQSNAAQKDCKEISNNKDVQEACKKVVKDVLKKKKDNPRDPVDACQAYGWCPISPPTKAPTTSSPTNAPTRQTAAEPTSDPTLNPTKSPHCTCAPTSLPTESPTQKPASNPTKSPTNNPTLVPTNTPTLSPTDPLPDEEECADCMGFLSNYESWQFWTAKKGCNKISTKKNVQKTCKKVVEDVFNDKKNPVDACKDRGWCEESRARARRTAECAEEPTHNPTDSPTLNPTSEPTGNPTSNPTKSPTDQPTSSTTSRPTSKPTSSVPTMRPTRIPTRNPTSNPTKQPTSIPSITPPDGLGNTLDDCIKVADQFRNTCTQFDIDSKHTVTNMTPEEVTCKNWPVDEEYGCIGDLQGDNSCVWERKLCVTCYTKNQGNTEITMIRVQTNNMPDHCPGNPLVQPQDFDYEVEFNRPPDITRVTFENQVVTKDILRPVQETRTYNNEASAEVCPLNHKYTGIQEMNDNSESKRVLAIAINGVAFQNANQKDDDPVFPLGSGLVEDQPLDLCMGHNQRNSDSGMYHYHFFSPCLNKEFHGVDRLDGMDVGTCVYHECEADTIKWALSGFQDGEYSGKSIIGLSKDGRPLYGPYKNDNNELWDWDKVDACNGVLDEDGSYFYVSTQWHPYISGCQGPTNLIQLGTDNDSRMPFYTNCSTNGLEEYAKDHNGVSHCKANGLSCVANQHCCSENPYCNPLETNDETIIKKECMKTEPDDIVFPTRRPDGAGCRISAECEVGSTCNNMFCRKQRG